MRKLFLLFSARMNSTRVPGKMLKPIWTDQCLLNVYLERLKRFKGNTAFCGSAIALNKADNVLWDIAKTHGCDIIDRSPESIQKGQPLNIIFDFAKDIDADHIMWVNGCQPFIRDTTIISAANTYQVCDKIDSLTAVQEKKTWMWDSDGVAVNSSAYASYRTDRTVPISCATQSFHIWNRQKLLDTGRPWGQTGPNDPYLFKITSPIEVLDTDTPEDFEIIKALYAWGQWAF